MLIDVKIKTIVDHTHLLFYELAHMRMLINVFDTQTAFTGFIQASLSQIQGLFKDFSRLSYTFQGLKVYEKS